VLTPPQQGSAAPAAEAPRGVPESRRTSARDDDDERSGVAAAPANLEQDVVPPVAPVCPALHAAAPPPPPHEHELRGPARRLSDQQARWRARGRGGV
jgi:hypothetical protein